MTEKTFFDRLKREKIVILVVGLEVSLIILLGCKGDVTLLESLLSFIFGTTIFALIWGIIIFITTRDVFIKWVGRVVRKYKKEVKAK